ncbi:carboxypeptidase-like regulatory domain-containing protein [Bradyrhizobium japonicum]|uniref:carboxypeptidase-like regulatory domain-containing protein n=1 Tax=Bradyrhizobium TaxID=374 RepID=UPI00117C1304|nr:carboxypeptidase-like regulatory domain-containing protein [Bradyrhizobium japonicum]
MSEKQGNVIIYVLGTVDSFPFALVEADVEIFKIADGAADATGPSPSRVSKKPPQGECISKGTTDSDGRYSTPLPAGTYQARATFAGGKEVSSTPFHICGDDTIEATVQVPQLAGFKVAVSEMHCRADYAEGSLCNLHFGKPTWFRVTWPSGSPVTTVAVFASGATVSPAPPPPGASVQDHEYYAAVLPTASQFAYLLGAASTGSAPALTSLQSRPGVLAPSVKPPPITSVQGDLSISLKRSASSQTSDLALSSMIRRASDALSFDRYMDFMNWIFCGDGRNDSALTTSYSSKLAQLDRRRFLPFTDTDGYRNIKAATEAFVMANCCIYDLETDEASYIADHVAVDLTTDPMALLTDYTKPDGFLPYLAVIRAKLVDERLKNSDIGDLRLRNKSTWPPHGTGSDPVAACYGVLREKLTCPCLHELIWSYWNEEGMLVQTINAITRRFQNMRGPLPNDPLANLEVDPLRPLNNLIWGWIQDEQHRLSVVRRNYEYDHQYGLRLAGKAVNNARTADSRSKFLEAFHTLLSTLAAFYKRDDDTTMVADGFPVLNALKEAHLILSQGAHNQFGDLPSTARIEMLMLQWILARPEFREFIPTRIMVAYPEPWMDRVDAMKKLQGWTDTSVLHFRNLAIFGEEIVLGVRYGNWNSIYEPVSAVNWARYWRPQVQGYLHAYRSVTGVDLSVDVTNARIDTTMPSVHLVKRLSEQRQRV